jgi:hypothetical protein
MRDEAPPCDDCRVVLDPENVDAMRVMGIVKRQYIMGFYGPIDINHGAVWEAIDRYGVKDPIHVFERVIRCSNRLIADMAEKQKEESQS